MKMWEFDEQGKIDADKAIAYFMGWRIDNSFPDKGKVWRSPEGDIELETTFKFSSDWNALMKVYRAVNDMEDYDIGISTSGICYVKYFKISEEVSDVDREWTTYSLGVIDIQESVYITLASFITYYNEEQLVQENGL